MEDALMSEFLMVVVPLIKRMLPAIERGEAVQPSTRPISRGMSVRSLRLGAKGPIYWDQGESACAICQGKDPHQLVDIGKIV